MNMGCSAAVYHKQTRINNTYVITPDIAQFLTYRNLWREITCKSDSSFFLKFRWNNIPHPGTGTLRKAS